MDFEGDSAVPLSLSSSGGVAESPTKNCTSW